MEPTVTVTAIGALTALVVAILLIFWKVPAFYSLMTGALLGGLIGGASLTETVSLMTIGASGMTTTILRILAAGILSGVLIKSGAAKSIAYSIINGIGESRVLLALTLAAGILTFSGVFIDIAVITVAPIALEIARQTGISRTAILVAMIGGGKSGNIISPNPNTLALSDAFDLPLTNLMIAGIVPMVFGVIATYFIANRITDRGSFIKEGEIVVSKEDEGTENLPTLWQSLAGPIIAILLLALRPITGIEIDPMLALPIGGLVGLLILGKASHVIEYITFGLSQMTGVAIILLGTGTISGIITNSTLGDQIISLVNSLGLPAFILAPIAGILMSAATASTTSGSAVAGAVFGETIVSSGVAPLNAAAMIHTGATVLDHLPHGSFFHATAGSVNMAFDERLKIIGYETTIGLVLTTVSTILYGIILG